MCKRSRTYYKYEIADILEVDIKTLSNYINDMYYEELKKLGYCKRQKKLTPIQVEWLKNKLGF